MARREIIVPICYRDTSMKQSACAATVKLAANERKMIAVRALAGTEPVSALAARHGVSRTLVYRQMRKASAALDELFSTEQTDDQNKVLFSLPVTKRWLEQATLRLTMIAHASTVRLHKQLQKSFHAAGQGARLFHDCAERQRINR
jgi:hypothetical protein